MRRSFASRAAAPLVVAVAARALDRLHAVTPPPGQRRRADLGRVAVEVLDLPHDPVRTRRPENVGFVVDLGGVTVLHVAT